MIKLILADLDGTLLDENGRVPDEFDDVIAELSARGTLFGLASGRQCSSVMADFAKYADRFVFIGDNGTMVRRAGRELFSAPLERAAALELSHAFDGLPQVGAVFVGRKRAYFKAQGGLPSDTIADVRVYFHDVAPVERFEDVDDEPIKLSFYSPYDDAGARLMPCCDAYKDDFKVVLGDKPWLDVTAKGADKGLGVRETLRALELTADECAAFGDFDNDLEMLRSVGYSCAMANALPEVKAAARFECPSNKEHGVILQIRRWIAKGLCGSAFE